MAASNDPITVMNDTQNQVSPSQNSLSFPQDALRYGTKFKFIKYQYALQANNASFSENINGAHVFLPLPQQLLEALSINYNAIDMGAAGALFRSGAGALQSFVNAKKNSDQDLKNSAGFAMDTTGYVLRKLVGDLSPETEAGIDQSTGTVVNPYNVATFKNVGTRQFNLSFRLIPRNPQEALTIQQIADTFHYHALPTKHQNSLFLDMPDEVEVEFFGTTQLFQFARCVITGVSLNYTPFGYPSFFNDDSPTGAELTVSLSEIQQLDRSAYNKSAALTDSFDYGDDKGVSNTATSNFVGLAGASSVSGD